MSNRFRDVRLSFLKRKDGHRIFIDMVCCKFLSEQVKEKLVETMKQAKLGNVSLCVLLIFYLIFWISSSDMKIQHYQK